MEPINSADIQILKHHIYEYHKGIRNMVLHTMQSCNAKHAEEILNRKNIPYHIVPVTNVKINIFFGNSTCVEIIKLFGQKSLSEYSDEQDFILGIMLGYDRTNQCKRYTQRKSDKSIKIAG